MCHGKYTPKQVYIKTDSTKKPQYNRTEKHKPKYEYYKEDYY